MSQHFVQDKDSKKKNIQLKTPSYKWMAIRFHDHTDRLTNFHALTFAQKKLLSCVQACGLLTILIFNDPRKKTTKTPRVSMIHLATSQSLVSKNHQKETSTPRSERHTARIREPRHTQPTARRIYLNLFVQKTNSDFFTYGECSMVPRKIIYKQTFFTSNFASFHQKSHK